MSINPINTAPVSAATTNMYNRLGEQPPGNVLKNNTKNIVDRTNNNEINVFTDINMKAVSERGIVLFRNLKKMIDVVIQS
ncbi:hypothetical protein [Veronia pacifica]|uniref:Uncharacterized protein n=1 Tax=Veronia pacifica TaxID=1080227 RepID=A0A1C3ELB4_9GAMM|nr:hypothetical protein [Veronia pacifica]ODA34037.1 hypothetical protein A8L45_08310 [Veronia pacifica]